MLRQRCFQRQSWSTMPCRRFVSAARSASSTNSFSPLSFMRVMRSPDWKAASDWRARLQLSARAAAIRSSSAFFFAAASFSTCFFFSSSLRSSSEGLADEAPGAGAVAGAAASGATAGATGAGEFFGRLRIFLSAMSGGGGRSLKTFRPSLSTHCHWAAAPILNKDKSTAKQIGFTRMVPV